MSEEKATYSYTYNAPTDTAAEAVAAADGAPIDAFRGEFAFLSNFFEQPIEIDGIVYPTGEHAFQAMKTREAAERYAVREAPTPAEAKSRGRRVTLREDWDTARFEVMETVLRAKFRDPELRRRLLATGDRTLIEGNTWRDKTWGAVRDAAGNWKGRNELGRLLMRIRDEIRCETEEVEETEVDAATAEDAYEPADRPALIAAAMAARENAYAPYSEYPVGAAVQTGDGRIIPGCNVENSSYGLSNCAERTAVFTAACEGARTIVAVAVATEDGGTPCGACRQVLSEFAPKDGTPMLVLLLDGNGDVVHETTLAALLPMAFAL